MLTIIVLHLARNYRSADVPVPASGIPTRHSVTLGVTVLFLAALLTMTELALRITHGLV